MLAWALAGMAIGAAFALALWLRDRQRLVAAVARLQTERDLAIQSGAEQREALAASQTQLRDAFAALSRAALRDNREDFLASASSLLTPVREALNKVGDQLAEVDKAREGSYQAVRAQLSSLQQTQDQLRTTAEGLSRSLGSPNIRGAWGEVQLRRIVELAGLIEHCDFLEKPLAASDTGARQTPDLCIRLPGGATLVVDSKVPIDAYRQAVAATDPAVREQALALHVRQVRDHMKALGAKEYWKAYQPELDFVVMFLPLEPLLQAAFERDASLFDYAASLHVVPATPMTLIALLKAVAAGWTQQRLADHAEQIRLIGRDLYDRLSTMVEHIEGVGRNLKQAAASYDRLIGSLEQNVVPSARRFKDLGVSSAKAIETPPRLHLALRTVTKEELTEPLAGGPADERAAR